MPQVLEDSDDEEVPDLEIKVGAGCGHLTGQYPPKPDAWGPSAAGEAAVPRPLAASNCFSQAAPFVDGKCARSCPATDAASPPQVPTARVKRIVGPGGATIKEIQKKSK